MTGTLQPLDQKFAIVDARGNPTDYFIRWAQQKQIDIGDSITLENLQTYLTEHALQEGSGIQFTPDGDLNNSPTIAADVQEILDQISTTRGAVLYRGLLGWAALAPGAAGQFLKTNGAGADPAWAAGGGGGGSAWSLVDQAGNPIVAGTCTLTIATPCVVTKNAHGLGNGQYVFFTTTGALPTGLTAGTLYFAKNVTANTFEVAATAGGASINTSGAQSGVHSATRGSTWSWSANVPTVAVTGLAGYNELLILGPSLTTSAVATRLIRVSVDNGATHFAAATDYQIVDTLGVVAGSTAMLGHSTGTAAARYLQGYIWNLKGPIKLGSLTTTSGVMSHFVGSMLDINAVRLELSAAGNITAGHLLVYAR